MTYFVCSICRAPGDAAAMDTRRFGDQGGVAIACKAHNIDMDALAHMKADKEYFGERWNGDDESDFQFKLERLVKAGKAVAA